MDGPDLDRTFVATRADVAAFLLDRVGSTEDPPLHKLRALDPGCGEGAIVAEIVRRLLRARRAYPEVGVADLLPAGRLAAITPNRWLQHDYGRSLRELIQREFALDILVDAEGAQLFDKPVQACPVISVIRRGEPAATLSARLQDIDPTSLRQLARELEAGRRRRYTTKLLVTPSAVWAIERLSTDD